MGMSYHMALLENILILCLNGMLYALTGGLVGAITKNRYMAYADPLSFIMLFLHCRSISEESVDVKSQGMDDTTTDRGCGDDYIFNCADYGNGDRILFQN